MYSQRHTVPSHISFNIKNKAHLKCIIRNQRYNVKYYITVKVKDIRYCRRYTVPSKIPGIAKSIVCRYTVMVKRSLNTLSFVPCYLIYGYIVGWYHTCLVPILVLCQTYIVPFIVLYHPCVNPCAVPHSSYPLVLSRTRFFPTSLTYMPYSQGFAVLILSLLECCTIRVLSSVLYHRVLYHPY